MNNDLFRTRIEYIFKHGYYLRRDDTQDTREDEAYSLFGPDCVRRHVFSGSLEWALEEACKYIYDELNLITENSLNKLSDFDQEFKFQ